MLLRDKFGKIGFDGGEGWGIVNCVWMRELEKYHATELSESWNQLVQESILSYVFHIIPEFLLGHPCFCVLSLSFPLLFLAISFSRYDLYNDPSFIDLALWVYCAVPCHIEFFLFFLKTILNIPLTWPVNTQHPLNTQMSSGSWDQQII